MTKTIIPYGYAPDIAKGYKHLDELMSVEETVLIDIRLKPYCEKFPAWMGASLEAHYGKKRYIWVEALGNLNYAKENRYKGFALKDQRAGLDRLRQGLDKGYRLVVMCSCLDYAHCHRSRVTQLLASEVPGLIVENKPKTVNLILLDESIEPINVTQPSLLEVPGNVLNRHFDQM